MLAGNFILMHLQYHSNFYTIVVNECIPFLQDLMKNKPFIISPCVNDVYVLQFMQKEER